MTTGKDAYKSVIADLRAQRDQIDNTIQMLEQLSGMTVKADSHGVRLVESDSDAALADDDGAFLGMSIAEAAIKLLGIKKRKMGNREIVDALVAGGLVMNSADPVNTVGSVLTRRFNQVGDIVRVARGTWGLKEWYPNRTFKSSTKSHLQPSAEKGADDVGDKPSSDDSWDDLIGSVSKDENNGL